MPSPPCPYAWATSPPGSPVAAAAATPSGLGYWMVTAAGTVRGFGDARSYGSAPGAPASAATKVPPPSAPAALSAIVSSPTGHGYWLVTGGGRVTSYGDAPGHASTPPLAPANPEMPRRRSSRNSCRIAVANANAPSVNANSGFRPVIPPITQATRVATAAAAGHSRRVRNSSDVVLRHGRIGATAIRNRMQTTSGIVIRLK